ncbi:MAG: phosphatidate cytidylyltransferase [Pseudomonadota bacterium]
MHLKRWLTSLVALPLLVVLILKGSPLLFSVFLGMVALLTSWEYSRIVTGSCNFHHSNPLFYVGLLAGAGLFCAAHAGFLAVMPLIFSFSLILTGFLSFQQFQNDPDISRKVALQTLGTIYIPLSISYLVLIRREPLGPEWVLLVVCVIFAGDTAAYYTGTYWGKHKLCPAVSPGKTVEGACGGLVANIGIGLFFQICFFPAFPLQAIFVFCLVIGIAGQAGDLFESVLKRSAGVKDSGGLLPGHGGILDRIDALLFALPVAFFLKVFFLTQEGIR